MKMDKPECVFIEESIFFWTRRNGYTSLPLIESETQETRKCQLA